ncbi:GNAT family N-acetyltransferase [Candidatus Saccharibacteria bacterium]|nr:GNAT family N-acetyltransferase [Candidatus Saccharibacteria bacterium]
MVKSFLQSTGWGQFQQNLGRKVYGNDNYIAVLERGHFSTRLFCPYGPNNLKQNLKTLTDEAQRAKVDFVRIEPRDDITATELKKLGFHKAKRDVNPVETIINDLADEPTIMATVSQGVRRTWRKLEKAGVEYELSTKPEDIEDFINMLHDTVQRTQLKGHDDAYYRQFAASLFPSGHAGLMFAKLSGQRVASVVWIEHEGMMSYLYAANLSQFRKDSPATGLGLFALLEAQRRGNQKFDWFGIAPEDDNNPRYRSWQGFTAFKLGFGGQRTKYLGTWELPLRKLRYSTFKLLQKLGSK